MTREEGTWLTTYPENAFTQIITKPQRNKVTKWLLENGAEPSEHDAGPRVDKFGERTDVFMLEGEPVILHTRPQSYDMLNKTVVRLDCSKQLAGHLIEDHMISRPRTNR